jgi:hypothetical protein
MGTGIVGTALAVIHDSSLLDELMVVNVMNNNRQKNGLAPLKLIIL